MAGSTIQVWMLSTALGDVDCGETTLSDEERQRAAKFVSEADRISFVATRAALRHILAMFVKGSPDELQFGRNPWGKPTLVQPESPAELDFSVSHTAGLSVIAVSRGRRIGVDIERDRVFHDKTSIVIQVFGSEVANRLAALPASGQDAVFAQLWTVGEAWLKAVGRGFAGWSELVPIALSLTPTPQVQIDCGHLPEWRGQWSVVPLLLPAGYIGSVVVADDATTPRAIRPRRLKMPPAKIDSWF